MKAAGDIWTRMKRFPGLRYMSGRLKDVDFETSGVVRFLLLAALVAVITALTPSQNQIPLHYEVGTVWTHEDVIAPFSFPIYKEKAEYDREVQQAKESVKPVFDRITIGERSIDSTASEVSQVRKAIDLQVTLERERNKTFYSRDSLALQSLLQSLPFKLSSADRNYLVEKSRKNRYFLSTLGQLQPSIVASITRDYHTGILDRPRSKIKSDMIVVRKNNSETALSTNSVMTIQDVSKELAKTVEKSLKDDSTAARLISEAIVSGLLPNLLYNRSQTQREIDAAVELVPRTVGLVKENERIIGRHDRITSEIKLKLDSLERALRQRTGTTDLIFQFLGRLLMVIVIVGLLTIYLFVFRKKVFYSNRMLALIGVLLIFESVLMFLAFTIQTNLPLQYLVLIPVASMILTVVFDSRLAFQGTIAMALLVGATRGNDFGAAFAALSGGAIALYTVRDIKNRTQIFRSLVFIFLGYGIATLATSFQRAEDVSTILTEFSLIGVNAILSPIITFGLLIFFERVFNITTDLTLLELSDFNQPLLRRLSQMAPGTFHHSIIVGTLAEKAAEAVGGNPILARVGAYYHDIGKMLKPEYFIENSMDTTKSKHDWLPPDISVQVVVSHVKDGIELARRHHLPQRVADFIPMHHGTTLVAYFYGKAMRRPFAKGDVSEEDYKYDGPRPNSKETAIVMLADSVEAATRSLQDKSLENVEAMVDAIVKSRYEEGQLDETNLTFADITRIKESFLSVLSGIYHQRIEYPGQKDKLAEELAGGSKSAQAEQVSSATETDEIGTPGPSSTGETGAATGPPPKKTRKRPSDPTGRRARSK